MGEFVTIVLITILSTISPGANFVVITKNTYLHGKSAGMATSAGISLSILVHVAFALLAVAALMKYAPDFLTIVKYIGGAYLIYIGYKTFTQAPVNSDGDSAKITNFQAFRNGFWCDTTNPETMLFVIGIYTQIVSATTPLYVLVGYGLFMSIASLVWCVLLTIVFSRPVLRERMLKKQAIINKAIGAILSSLGGVLLFANVG